nr:MarR family transcriptional regulator [Aeromicrobium sp.]
MRTVDPSDRRVRIPQITDNGRKVYATFAAARDAAEARALDGVDASDRVLLLDVLAKIANSPDTADATT